MSEKAPSVQQAEKAELPVEFDARWLGQFEELWPTLQDYFQHGADRLTKGQKKQIADLLTRSMTKLQLPKCEVTSKAELEAIVLDHLSHWIALSCLKRETYRLTGKDVQSVTGYSPQHLAGFVHEMRSALSGKLEHALDHVHTLFPYVERDTLRRYYYKYYGGSNR